MVERSNIEDVALLARVSRSSVSRVLNSHPNVTPRLREKVMSAAQQLGYSPDINAASLRYGKTKTIGMVVRDLASPLYADILHGIEQAMRAAGYSTIVANSDGDPEVGMNHINLFRQRRVDGLILSLDSDLPVSINESIGSIGCPVILLDRDIPIAWKSGSIGAVWVDHYGGCIEALERLIAAGHRRVGFIGGPEGIRPSRERYAAYVDVLARHGIPLNPSIILRGEHSIHFGGSAAREMLSTTDSPTAFFAAGVELAAGVLIALQDLPTARRREMDLVTCDYLPLMMLSDVRVTVVDRDRPSIGTAAANALLSMIRGGESGQILEIPTSVRLGGSL